MTIATLEKIHELLKGDVKAAQNARDILQKAYDDRKRAVERMIYVEKNENKQELAAAVQAREDAQKVYDDALQAFFAAETALHDFEAQEF